jgi:hypothetical protein
VAFSVLADSLCGLVALVVFMGVSLAWSHDIFLSGKIGSGIVLSAAGLLSGTLLLLGMW